jgi:uncharacterized protein (DUF58 family)
MLLVVLGGLWLLCLLWSRSLARGLILQREMRFGWTQVGDRLEERFVLSNNSNMPALWIEVLDQSSMPDYDTSRGTGIGGMSQTEWRTQGQCTHRGVFTLGPTRLTTGDPFGLYTVSMDFQSSQSLLVLPPIIPLPSIEVAPGGRVGEGRPRPNAPDRTVSAAGVRDYVHGDSVRWIHWRTSAHRNSLFVRIFDSTPASDWWIILDMDRTAQAGAGQNSTEEHAITLAASLADRGLRDGKSVGLITHGENLVWLPPRGGDAQRWTILRSMALLRPGTVPIAELMTRMKPTFGKQASLIIITAAVDSRWMEELVLLMRRGAVPTVLFLDVTAYEPLKPQQKANGTLEAATSLLSNLGVSCYTLSPDVFSRPEAQPGHLGVWDLQVLPTGMVVPVGHMHDFDWRPLS